MSAGSRLLSVCVDLDGIALYESLYGIRSAEPDRLLYQRAVVRLSDWARQRGLPLTWFVVGADLRAPENAEAVARLASGGDELGCHSYSHHYDLTRRSVAEMQDEVQQGVQALERAGGVKVRGFRAPGYVVSDTLLALLREAGLAYDSSVFPCPAYYTLKAGMMAALSRRGRDSCAILDVPDVLRSPTVPYRVGRPYWFRGTGIWEIPIQVTRRARLPFIGTALTVAGPRGARLLARGVVGQPFVNLELHGLDALDAADGLGDLAPYQRDLRIPWSRKLEAIDSAVTYLQRYGHRGVRMDELAAAAAALG